MSRIIYGVSWIETVEPERQNMGATKRRMSQTFHSFREREKFVRKEKEKDGGKWEYTLSEWEDNQV